MAPQSKWKLMYRRPCSEEVYAQSKEKGHLSMPKIGIPTYLLFTTTPVEVATLTKCVLRPVRHEWAERGRHQCLKYLTIRVSRTYPRYVRIHPPVLGVLCLLRYA
jgi:hypothetical protein